MSEYLEDELREELSEDEENWAKELADLIYQVSQAYAYANVVEHAPQAFVHDLPKKSKSVVYARALEILAHRADLEGEMQSGMVH